MVFEEAQRLTRILAVMLCVLASATHADAGNIYVQMNGGSDVEGDGSSTDPFQTIDHAIGVATSGDVIRVRGGTTSADYYTAANGEQFPLKPGSGVSIIGDEELRIAWPRIGGDVAGSVDALVDIEASTSSGGGRTVGTISKLYFRGEDVEDEDSPVALKIVATDGYEAGVTFVDNVCERAYLNSSGSSGLATISMYISDGAILSTFIEDNSIECSNRGGIEMMAAAGTDEVAGYGVRIDSNYIFTQDQEPSLFGIKWHAFDMGSTNPATSASMDIVGNIIRPENGGIVSGLQIICEEHNHWGSNSVWDNIIDGCSDDGVVLSSDGWEDENDAEITIGFTRNKVVNNGGSGVVLIWDATNHSTDLGYGYIHFHDEGSLIGGNAGYGFELRGIGVNSSVSEFRLVNTTVVENAPGGELFADLALGETDPEDELVEAVGLHGNCIMYGNDTTSGDQVHGISGDVLDALLATVWYSNWEGHPLAAQASDPCVPEATYQYVIDCDPEFESEVGVRWAN